MDFFQDDGGRAQRHAAAFVFLGDEGGQKARFGERGDELVGVALILFETAPVLAGKLLADAAHAVAHFGEVFAQGHGKRGGKSVHGVSNEGGQAARASRAGVKPRGRPARARPP